MINAKELRIGNYVHSLETGETQKITGITEEHPYINSITFDYPNYDEIEPIPLTEEWLLKFGFKKAEGSDCDYKLQIQKDNKQGNTEFDIWIDFGEEGVLSDFPIIQIVSQNSEWLRTDIKYIHQLQNLYFSLKGYELTLS